MDEVPHGTCGGEGGGGRGGGMSMDDAFADISELGREGRPRSWGEWLNSVASGDACDGDLGGVNHSLEA